MYIRVPVELREMIERSAEASERSLNGEIIFQLRRAYEAGSDGEKKRSKKTT